MTTITNFLHCSFSDIQKQQQEHQIPIWVVNGTRQNKMNNLKQYIVNNCIANNKLLLHLDLGLSVCRTIANYSKTIIQDGLILATDQNTSYFVLNLTSNFRTSSMEYLSIVIKTLSDIKKYLPSQLKKSLNVSLLIEGLEIINVEANRGKNLQSFINEITSLPSFFKQIIIFKYEGMLHKEHQFALQRISTCLTHIENYDNAKLQWLVKSTVRRYTGYSNEEKYIIRMQKNSKIKVEKWVAVHQQEETESQKKMISQLGFVVKKGQSIAQQDNALKQMIYPHLRVQNKQNSSCNKKQCVNCSCSKANQVDEGLIILDDEQEDDDDIDV